MKHYILNKNGKEYGKISINVNTLKKLAVLGGLVFSLNALTGCGNKEIEVANVDPAIESMLDELDRREDLSLAMPEHVDYVNYTVQNGDTLEDLAKKYLTDDVNELKSRENDIVHDNVNVRENGLIDGQDIRLRNVKSEVLDELGYTNDINYYPNFHAVSQEIEFLVNVKNVIEAQMVETENKEYQADLYFLLQEINSFFNEYESENKLATDKVRNSAVNLNAEIFRITNYNFNDYVKPIPKSAALITPYSTGAIVK